MLEWTAVNGISGQLAADNLGYVMIDGGPDWPYGAYVFTPGFGADDAPTPTPMSNKQLFTALYQRNKPAFWIGGSVVGVLALAGLFGLVRR